MTTVYGWERRQANGAYELIASTLSAFEGEAHSRAIGACGGGWLWFEDKRVEFSQQWNSGQIRPAVFELGPAMKRDNHAIR